VLTFGADGTEGAALVVTVGPKQDESTAGAAMSSLRPLPGATNVSAPMPPLDLGALEQKLDWSRSHGHKTAVLPVDELATLVQRIRAAEPELTQRAAIALCLDRIATALEAVYDPERKALRLYDVERAKVYKAALAPEYRDKFGMDSSKPEQAS
jgi:hypothetical protein